MIWFLRHGEAEESGSDDHSRGLTDKGFGHARNAGRALAALGVVLDACLTSPKLRARRTAELACRELGVRPQPIEALRDGNFDAEALAAGRGEVLLVGHKPNLQLAIQWATGGLVKLKVGSLVGISNGELCHVWTPAELGMLARSRGSRNGSGSRGDAAPLKQAVRHRGSPT